MAYGRMTRTCTRLDNTMCSLSLQMLSIHYSFYMGFLETVLLNKEEKCGLCIPFPSFATVPFFMRQ